MLDERRLALKNGDHTRYVEIVQLMNIKEELLIQEKLLYITKVLNISE